MSHAKNQPKNSEADAEKKVKKHQQQQVVGAIHDLPGVIQRVTNESTRRPGDILKLQQTIGNRKVHAMLGPALSTNVTSGTIQRHISSGLVERFRTAARQFDEASYRGADAHRAADQSVDQFRGAASDAHNAALAMEQAHIAARNEGAPGQGE